MRTQRHTLLIEFAYRGAGFHGLFPQPGLRTAGGALRELLEGELGVALSGLAFAARTDRGVAAAEQNFATAWFRAEAGRSIDTSRLDGAGAEGLRVHDVSLVQRSVHARNAATSKHYRYTFTNSPPPDDLRRQNVVHEAPREQAWAIAPRLDLDAMQRAAALLVGRHDFSSFRAAGCSAKNPVKTLERLEVECEHERTLLDVEGDAFLRKMVRILAGTLAEVGAGLRPVSDVERILAARDRRAAGMTAPAHGLTLCAVRLAPVVNRGR